MNSTNSQTPNDSTPATGHHRRSREEVEALAKNFVATPLEEVVPAKPRQRIAMAAGAGAVVLLAVVAAFAWPKRQVQRDTTAQAEAAAEAEQWKARFEAEKERKRKELEAGADYLERIAASDAAMLKDLSSRADRLAARQEAALAAATEAPPTPREQARPQPPATTVASASKPAPATTTTTAPAPATTAQQKPAAPAEQAAAKPAPATAQPTTVAQAPAVNCAIHVSELSSSGKLTYEDIKRMKGARLDEDTGHVFTPPVQAAGGRTVVFEVMPDGCVKVGRR